MQRIKDLIETTVSGLGYEVVDIEFAASALLRVYIDWPYVDGADAPQIQIADCEKVSHQLGHVLLVEEFDYDRLEVSSPGMDRPLKSAAHFQRFAGEMVSVKLREAFHGRRNFRGLLCDEGDGRFGLELTADALAPKNAKGAKGAKGSARNKRAGEQQTDKQNLPPDQAQAATHKLIFEVNEVERARLVPQYDFRRH